MDLTQSDIILSHVSKTRAKSGHCQVHRIPWGSGKVWCNGWEGKMAFDRSEPVTLHRWCTRFVPWHHSARRAFETATRVGVSLCLAYFPGHSENGLLPGAWHVRCKGLTIRANAPGTISASYAASAPRLHQKKLLRSIQARRRTYGGFRFHTAACILPELVAEGNRELTRTRRTLLARGKPS
jgi:hypothetical protein